MALKKDKAGETAKEYFDRIRLHHRQKMGDLKNVPIDLQLVRHEKFLENHVLRCGYCNSSYMEDSISPYECKDCWKKRMKSIFGDDEQIDNLYKDQFYKRKNKGYDRF